ncbi:non-heme iron oxygenase ferredoxin subunit [Gaopeijia maritima]|uniref:Non-heme iron oxygenase ferredoxin subunit n=1 Tax=Gaopeijia maritima TaxID=3119007 RepID=A0ABU9E6F1_9BACT
MSDWVKVAAAADCPPGEFLALKAGREFIVLCNVEGTFYALRDQCSHEDLPLSNGDLEGSEFVCIHHGARFDVCTGRALCLPAIRPVKTFEVEVRDADVFVRPG